MNRFLFDLSLEKCYKTAMATLFSTCLNIIQDKRGGTFEKKSVYSDNIK